MATILVTGGAGYIGSFIVRELVEKGYKVIVIDNLVYGHKKSLPKEAVFVEGDIGDKELLSKIFTENKVDAVMHLAAFCYVGESVKQPEKYFKNNVHNSLILLDTMLKHNVKKMVFSSTCSVYGIPDKVPITEEEPVKPINPYGETKLIFENKLKEIAKKQGLKFISLRYFNAAGAALDGDMGEDHDPETHLIPIILQTALGKREHVEIYGTDYETDDGTCIRDYIHVLDLASVHILALEALDKAFDHNFYNLGTGKGYSVKEIISVAKDITKKDLKVAEIGKREGDPAVLVAANGKIKKELEWEPKYGIKDIIQSAWLWHSKHPEGYGDKI